MLKPQLSCWKGNNADFSQFSRQKSAKYFVFYAVTDVWKGNNADFSQFSRQKSAKYFVFYAVTYFASMLLCKKTSLFCFFLVKINRSRHYRLFYERYNDSVFLFWYWLSGYNVVRKLVFFAFSSWKPTALGIIAFSVYHTPNIILNT